MHVRVKSLTVAFVVGLATIATAQDAAAPTLTPDAVTRLQNFELRAENIALKQAQLAAAFAALQAEANAFAKSLQRDGYTLARGDDGAWRYVAVPKEEPKP